MARSDSKPKANGSALCEILVPLDGSEMAECALSYVKALAPRLGCRLLLFTACTPGDPLERLYRAYLEKKTDELKSQGIGAGSELARGDPASQILDFAERGDMRLIAISAHGCGGVSRWPLGSIARKVLAKSHTPVLLIRTGGPRAALEAEDVHKTVGPELAFLPKEPFRILVPLDGSPVAQAIIPYVEALAYGMACDIALLRVAEPIDIPRVGKLGRSSGVTEYEREWRDLAMEAESEAKRYLGEMEIALANKGINVRSASLVGKPVDTILQFADDCSADLVALATHGFSGISRWAFGSVASKVVEGSSRPVLLVRPSLPSQMTPPFGMHRELQRTPSTTD
jgi:nucleotide-binding universal stress UspA family protein